MGFNPHEPDNQERMTFTFGPAESAAIRELADAQDISHFGVVRQALRLYQFHCHRLAAGETCTWSGDEQRARKFFRPESLTSQHQHRGGQMHNEEDGFFGLRGQGLGVPKPRKKPKWQDPIETSSREVDNPEWDQAKGDMENVPRTMDVKVNTRESSIIAMNARGQIDDGQLLAAERFRKLHEQAGFRGVQALDYEKQKVDGGNPTDGLTDARMDAARQLATLKMELGQKDYELCVYIAGEGYSVTQAAEKILGKRPSDRDIRYYSRRMKDSFDTLCNYWGFKAKAA